MQYNHETFATAEAFRANFVSTVCGSSWAPAYTVNLLSAFKVPFGICACCACALMATCRAGHDAGRGRGDAIGGQGHVYDGCAAAIGAALAGVPNAAVVPEGQGCCRTQMRIAMWF